MLRQGVWRHGHDDFPQTQFDKQRSKSIVFQFQAWSLHTIKVHVPMEGVRCGN
jgi:hypothetical protein